MQQLGVFSISRAREQNLAVEREYFYQQHSRGKRLLVFYPDGWRKRYWDWVVAFAVVAWLVGTPSVLALLTLTP